MNKSVLLATVLPLMANGAFAATPTVLWDQSTVTGDDFIFSENLGSDMTAGADDFVVPAGQTWLVKELDITGVYFNGSGPATSEIVTFYSDRRGLPNRVHQGPFTLNCTDNFGSFQCKLPRGVKFKTGTWWMSFVVNMSFEAGGEWGWGVHESVQNNEAVWEHPTGSTCTTWTPLHLCGGGPPSDLAFQLLGRAMSSN